jgi:putative intracellular protease/amidase
MHDELVDLLDKVDMAVAESEGVLEQSTVDAVANMARDMRVRLSYPESVVVAALAGGTGSGKSSLLNAVAGEELALTGGIRPMTSKPLALVPSSSAGALSGYLDALGITERVEHHGPSWLCLLDLPDNDSVEVDHRHQVDALLPRVDVVVWVTDPEKYNDASLHHGYIAPLAGHQGQFLFVLNQVDRLDEADARLVEEDFVSALGVDGITEPTVIITAAQPAAGPPMGIERLLASLEEVRAEREAVHAKSLTDLAVAASRLIESSSGASGVDFETRWADEVVAAVDLAIEGRAAGGAHDLAAFITVVADEVGGETGGRLQELAVEAHVSFLECVAHSQRPGGRPEPRPHPWWARLRRMPRSPHIPSEGDSPGRDHLIDRVDDVIGNPIREILVRRGRAHAAITELALALGDLERRAT